MPKWSRAPTRRFVPFTEADTIATYFPGLAPFGDLLFHGTHTGATVSSNAVRAAGVTSKTNLVAVKVCAYLNQCPFSSILNGVIYAADHGADVMNLSLGGAFPKRGNRALIRLINATFNYARNKGVTIVVSAGNEATDLGSRLRHVRVVLRHAGRDLRVRHRATRRRDRD